jgi:hypothetical protein
MGGEMDMSVEGLSAIAKLRCRLDSLERAWRSIDDLPGCRVVNAPEALWDRAKLVVEVVYDVPSEEESDERD